jgi:hypothetical protein
MSYMLTQYVVQAGTLWEYKADRRMPFGLDKEACCSNRELSGGQEVCILASTCRSDCEICEQCRRR